jgi:hypothetical protein
LTIFHLDNNELSNIPDTSFASQGVLERSHIQQALKKKIDVIAPDCMVIAEEFSEWSEGKRRIDLLAVDRNANVIVIELKRGTTGELMELQAIRYAAMVSTLTFKRAIEIFENYLRTEDCQDDAQSRLLEFFGWDDPQEDDFAIKTRIMLVSEDFGKELTTAVLWLNDQGLDIKCMRMKPYQFEGSTLVDVQQIVPIPGAEKYQVRVRKQSEERKTARETARDHTRYEMEGQIYNKRKLVYAVVNCWCEQNSPYSYEQITTAFPDSIRQNGPMFVSADDAVDIYQRQNIKRHFIDDDELFTPDQQEPIALSNQWGGESHKRFVERAISLGFEIS